MAPWPEQGNEPKAPDKSCSKSGDSSVSDSSKVNSGTTVDLEVNTSANKNDDKQPEDKNPDVSNLDDGQLKALLDEAITYKRPKDREGKSDLFKELLQEAEADESECGDGRRGGAGAVPEQVVPVSGSRYYSNSNRRRGRRDSAVSERQTRGGSLQNLVHASNSEFDTSGFGFFGQSSGHSGGVGKRKSKRGNSGRDYCVSVSARQREGGSLPSNVNVGGAGGGMLTLSGLEFPPTAPLSSAATAALLFDDARGYVSKQNKQRKELGHTLSSNEFSTTMPVHSSTSVSYQTGGENLNNVSKTEFMVVDLEDMGENGQEAKTSGVVIGDSVIDGGGGKGSVSGGEGGKLLVSDVCSNGMDDEQGTEMEVIQRSEASRVPNYTSHATLEVGLDCNTKSKTRTEHGDVDTTIAFPLGSVQCEKSGGVVNGVEQSPLQLPSSYNSVKCIVGSSNNNSREDRNCNASKGNDVVMKQHSVGSTGGEVSKTATTATTSSMLHNMYPMQHVSVLSIPPTSRWIATSIGTETVNRLTFNKDPNGDGKNKSLDENGNAVNQNYRLESVNSNDRKSKLRRMKTNNDRNVIMSQNIEGHRGDKDIESLIKFIESDSDSKVKTKNNSSHSNGSVGFGNKQQRNNVRREEVVGGTKTRRDRVVDDGHDEEKTSGRNRVGGKQSSKEHRGSEKVGSGGGQLKKSNSLEEFSKTKLEDLTTEQTGANSTSSTCSSSSTQVTLRRPKKQSTLDDEELYSEKARANDTMSWVTEDGQHYYGSDGTSTVSADESGPMNSGGRKRRGLGDEKKKYEDGVPAVVVSNTITSEETEFLVVTKKKARKKRRSSSGGRTGSTAGSGHGGLFGDENRRPAAGSQYGHSYQNRGDPSFYQRKGFTSGNGNGFPPHDRMVVRGDGVMLYQYRHHHRPRSPEHLRRKSTSSMPPSDKSDSSDLDSVHSLPPSLSSTTPKISLDPTSTSSGSTPQASYADITRMASSNTSSSSSTQGSCSINAGKWPAMIPSKSQMVPSSTTATTSTCTTTITTTSISSTSSSSIASVTNICTTTTTTTVPALAAPLALNNPQFITGPRLNIGVPPVSGSKLTVTTSANPTSNTSTVSNNPSSVVHPVSVTTGDTSASVASSQITEPSTDSSRHKHNPHPSDPRTKKDAMTSTTLDYKLIPEEEHNPGQKPQAVINKGSELQSPSPNVIMDNYYPSLEESLVEKMDRKSSRCNSSVHSSTANKLPAEENSSTIVIPSNVNAANTENAKSARHQELSDEIVKQQPVDTSMDATVIVPKSSLCSTGESVPSEVLVASAVMTGSNTNRSKETTSRSKNSGRKVSAAGSSLAVTSLVRPPVIIMDEQEQEAAFRENVGTVSELTFGFEVNEQLLLSDIDDNSRSTSAEPPSFVEAATVDSSPTIGIASDMQLPEEATTVVPVATNNASEDFSARYREPITQQSENHDLIVTFVGLAWDDVLKEMSATPIQAGGKIQYYSGQ